QRTSQQIELYATFERRSGVSSCAPATASPQLGQSTGEHNRGAAVDAHTREALQDWDAQPVASNHMLHTGAKDLLQECGSSQREALANRLGRNIDTDTSSTLGEL